MCSPPDIPGFDDVFDFFEDVIDGIIDIVEDIVSWIIPIPEMPDFDQGFNDPTARTDGILVNKQSSSAEYRLYTACEEVEEH